MRAGIKRSELWEEDLVYIRNAFQNEQQQRILAWLELEGVTITQPALSAILAGNRIPRKKTHALLILMARLQG